MKYVIIVIAIIVLAWCPWFKAPQAQNLIDAKVLQMIATIPHLCPMYIHRETIGKVPFGYSEKVSYDCTTVDPVFGVEQSFDYVFVTFYGSIIGMPKKTLEKQF